MNKIRLSLDGLSVESFPTAGKADDLLGTVHAFAPTGTGGACATCKGATCFTSCAGAGANVACTCPII